MSIGHRKWLGLLLLLTLTLGGCGVEKTSGVVSTHKAAPKKVNAKVSPPPPLPPSNNVPSVRLKRVEVKAAINAVAVNRHIAVAVDLGNVREAPGENEPVQDELKEGTSLHAIAKATVDGDLWYEVQEESGTPGWISSEIVKLIDQPSALLEAPVVDQLPELERGCEVTSLAMLIEQAGKKADKMTLAKQIKTIPFTDKNGYRGNPNDGFVGNIYTFSQPGLGVYHGPVYQLAKQYLGPQTVDLTGTDWKTIQEKLASGHAVWVIINSTFRPLPQNDPFWYTFKTKEGSLRVTYKEHSVLVTGYSPNSVYINDPLSGKKNVQLNKENFIKAWEQMGSQAISY
jgi:uncharacterized protein YvpB